jgi:hypothetical protein
MARAKDGDLERLEPVRGVGRFASSDTARRNGSKGRSTRTGRGIWARSETLTLKRRMKSSDGGNKDATRHNRSRHVIN